MKKLFTLFFALMAIVMGAQAETYVLGFADETVNSCNGSYAAGTATFTCGTDVFTVTNTNDDPTKVKTNSNANYTGSDKVKRYGVKYSQNVVFTVNIPTGVAIKSVTFSGWSNSDATTTQINKINDADVTGETGNSFGTKGAYDSWTYEFATAQTGSFTFVNKGAEGVFNITLTTESAPATEPTITAQPTDAAYVIGTSDYPVMSVEATASAGELLYDWLCDLGAGYVSTGITTKEINLQTAIENYLEAFGNVAGSCVLKCVVTDENASVESNEATLSIVNGEAPTISVAADKTVALKGGKITLTATITGTPDPTIQWYSKTGGLIQVIEGATSAEFTPSTTEYGAFEYLAKAENGAGTAYSDPITVTVKPALQSVKFSNGVYGVYGAIIEPATAEVSGNIEVPYINYGETPEIDETSWTAFNDTEAEISTEENVVTVISGAYSATYNYEFIPVNPIAATADIASTNFTEDPSWVFNKYGYDAKKGVKFAKAVDEADNLRIAKGNTRQYYFVGPAKSLSLTAVESVDSKSAIRNVNVYVNGALFKENTANNAIGAITLSPTSDNIVIIEAAADTKGDGGFSAFSIAACDVKPVIDSQPANMEWTVGETTYPSMSVEATGAGAMKYQWEFSTIGDAQTFQSFPSSVTSAATATLSGEEFINAFSTKLTAGTYYARCRVTDDNGTAYSDAATFTIKDGSAPTITTQPQDATYVIGTEDYPSMSVEAVASAGELKYQWHIIVSETDVTIPGATTATLSLATYASSPAFAPYLSQEGSYSIYCNVADDNGNVDSNTATLTVSEAAPGPELDEQTDVTGDMTWDWSKFGTTEIKFLDDGTTTPKKPSTPPTADEEFVLSNVIAYGWCESIGADFGDAQALKVACEYPVRDGSYFQGPILRFNTTVPGTVTVTCSSTGSKDNHNRDVIIGGVVAGQVTNTTMADFTAEVADGEVLIKGVSHGAGADADAQYLRISKIVFTAGGTAVDAVSAEAEAAVAPAKVIVNGKLFIGNFNVAGQRVK